jgi:succinate dehydrogenase / fumarate reductase flavoprotein subunit
MPVMTEFQSKTILMSESLRNDARMWVPVKADDTREPNDIPESERDYYLERKYPAYGNLVPRDVASRNGKEQIDSGHGVGPLKNATYLDLRDAIQKFGEKTIMERYGNLLEMYEKATGENPLQVPMRVAPRTHYTMGGLWADYNLMTSIPGLFVGGECGYSYHAANRLGANSLLSGSVDGWFTLPFSVPNFLADRLDDVRPALSDTCVTDAVARSQARLDKLVSINGSQTPSQIHRKLGDILFDKCGLARNKEDLTKGIQEIRDLREEFWNDVKVTGGEDEPNTALEKAGRVADFLELGELMCVDALDRDESCGAHLRVDHEANGEAVRDDEHWMFTSAWESDEPASFDSNPDLKFTRHAEPLEYSAIHVATRNYK